MSISQGYRDGRSGRNNANHNAEYTAGWLIGWRERMLAWNSISQPATMVDTLLQPNLWRAT